MTAIHPSRVNSPPRRRRRRYTARTITSIVAVALGLIWAFPLYWMINTALTAPDQLRSSPPTLFPLTPTFDSFAKVLADPTFWSSMAMSMQVTLIAVVVSLLAATLAAVTLSRYRFRGRTSIIVAVLVVQMIPAEALFISQFRMLGALDLLNTVGGLSLLYVGSVLPFTVWMLKGFVDGVPIELEEAAMVDGCSKVGAFFRVTFPLLGPGLVATGIFGFLASWNEFTLALVVLSSGTSVTLPVWLAGFQTSLRGTDWGGVMAGSTLIAVPVIVLFIFVQSRMSTGMTVGAVKG